MTTQIGQAPPSASLADRAYLVLRDRLVMLDIAPGAPLNEARLAAEMGFGRTPLREALKRLEADHLVVTFARRGTFASTVDITELAAISEVRLQLEPLAARYAALRATAASRDRLAALAGEISELDNDVDPSELLRFDIRVHRAIYEAAGNHHLQASLVRLDNLATRIWCLVLDRLPDVGAHVAEHASLLGSILEGDAEAAARQAVAHVQRFEQAMRSVL